MVKCKFVFSHNRKFVKKNPKFLRFLCAVIPKYFFFKTIEFYCKFSACQRGLSEFVFSTPHTLDTQPLCCRLSRDYCDAALSRHVLLRVVVAPFSPLHTRETLLVHPRSAGAALSRQWAIARLFEVHMSHWDW